MWELVVEYFDRIGQYPRWVVTVELLIIGLVVYWTVNFLEGTRGERLFRGVFFVLFTAVAILHLVVKRYGFTRIEYLYNGFLITILIVAVAAFQPELRRMLIRIGQTRFLSSSPQQLSRTVEEIITAVTQMSTTRTGAIIAVEQQVGLGEFIETGVRIDAKVTAELMKTIFYPGTPLHDMAVVIRGDRIVAAKVQLPLAELGTLGSAQLGSRHRAAIGITTGSDATVIVVSEETGIISLALNGNLIRNVPESQLRRQLTAGLVDTVPLVEKIKKQKKKPTVKNEPKNT